MKKSAQQTSHNSPSTATVVKPNNKTSKTLLYFILKFAILFLLFEACYFNETVYNTVFLPINKAFAFLTAKLLSLVGMGTSSSGDLVSSKAFSMSVKQGCDSIEALAIFVFGVLAFPATLSIKWKGLLTGIVLILGMNLIRLMNLFWVGVNYPSLFDLFHLEIWQGFFIVFSIVLWILWVLKAIQQPKPLPHAE